MDKSKKIEVIKDFLNTELICRITKHGIKYNVSRFANDLGIPQPSLSRYLIGDLMPSSDNLFKLIHHFPQLLVMLEMEEAQDPLLRFILLDLPMWSDRKKKVFFKFIDKLNKSEED